MPKIINDTNEARALSRGALALRLALSFLLAASLFLFAAPAFAEPDEEAISTDMSLVEEESLLLTASTQVSEDAESKGAIESDLTSEPALLTVEDSAIIASDYVPTGNEITVPARQTSTGSSPLQASVTYDPNFSKGKSTRFTFNITGNTRSTKYKLNSFEVQTESGWSPIIDTSKSQYGFTPNNYFDAEIYAAGNYRLSFWTYEYTVNEEGKDNIDQLVRFQIEFTVSSNDEFESLAAVVKKVTSECLSECAAAGDSSDYAKALWLNDWIVDNTTYDWSLNYMGADGPLLRGTATCEGYHAAYVMLLNEIGIETRRIPSAGDGHVWTGVKLNGKWYHVDVTWNDGYQALDYPDAKHLYFALPNSIVQKIHPYWDGNYQISLTENPPFEANSYDDNYFIRSGQLSEYLQPYLSDESGQYSVKKHFAEKETGFTVPIVHTEWAGEADKQVIYGLVAHQLEGLSWGDGIKLSVGFNYANNELTFLASYESQDNADMQGSQQNTSPSVTEQPFPNVSSASGTWVKSGNRWWFDYDVPTKASQGKAWPAGEWVNIDGSRYYFDGNGWMCSNWNNQNGAWYWHGSDGAMKTGWVKTGGKWYFMNGDGRMATRWLNDGGNTYYLDDSSGAMATGWRMVDGTWYHLGSSGAMTKGWLKSGGKWYYLANDGKMLTGMQNIAGAQYYLNAPNGEMVTGWVFHNGSWYWGGSSGAMSTGWIKTGGKWYFMNGDCRMATRWLNDDGNTYYLDDSSGAMATGWRSISGDWYNFNGSGAMQIGRWIGNYYVGSDGKMAVNDWIDRWHVGADGKWDATR